MHNSLQPLSVPPLLLAIFCILWFRETDAPTIRLDAFPSRLSVLIPPSSPHFYGKMHCFTAVTSDVNSKLTAHLRYRLASAAHLALAASGPTQLVLLQTSHVCMGRCRRRRRYIARGGAHVVWSIASPVSCSHRRIYTHSRLHSTYTPPLTPPSPRCSALATRHVNTTDDSYL